MDHDPGVITHPKFRIWLRPDGIVQAVMAPRATMGLEDALAALADESTRSRSPDRVSSSTGSSVRRDRPGRPSVGGREAGSFPANQHSHWDASRVQAQG